MNYFLLIKSLLIAFLFLVPIGLDAQENREQLVYLKFENYSVEKNKRVQVELKNEKVLFTCIPAGIVIIKPQPSKVNSNLSLGKTIEKLKRNYSFEFVNDLSMEQAENACSKYRNGENQK